MTAGAREWLKWVALLLMVGDHINAALLGRSVPWLYDLGRIVMPTFAAVLAFNLAGYGNVQAGRYVRVFWRLLLVGAIAYPFHVAALGQGWAVGNVLFGYAAAVGAMYLIDRWGERGLMAAAVLVAVAGGFVEFYWSAPLVTLAWWYWWRRPGAWTALALTGCYVMLCVINGNGWALLSIPLVLIVKDWPIRLRRQPWAFYVFYPAHLAALVLLASHGAALVQDRVPAFAGALQDDATHAADRLRR